MMDGADLMERNKWEVENRKIVLREVFGGMLEKQ